MSDSAESRMAEVRVIGAALRDPDVVLAAELEPRDFEHPGAQVLWQAMLDEVATGWRLPAELIARAARSDEHREALQRFADEAVLVGRPRDAGHFADRVRHHATTRHALEVASQASELCANGRQGEALVLELLARLEGLRVKTARVQSQTAAELAERAVRLVLHGDEDTGLARYVPTGLERIDKAIAGWQGGIVSVVAARTSHGKSTFLLQCARHAASLGIPVHVLSAEDLESDTTMRLLAEFSDVPVSELRRYGKLDAEQARRVAGGFEREKALLSMIRLTSVSGLSARQCVSLVRISQPRDRTGLVIFDYLQRLPVERGRSRHETFAAAMNEFDCAAKSDGLPWVVASQVKRSQNETPQLEDLRESGTIEEIAKLVIGLHRPRKGCPERDDAIRVQVLKASNDDLVTGTFGWDGPRFRILDRDPTLYPAEVWEK